MPAEDDLINLVARMRRTGAELSDVEVKAAAGGLPRSVPDTLSAFANGSGGTVLLGLVEDEGFQPAPGFDATAIRDALAAACAEKVSPPVREPVEIVEFEGRHVVRVDVDELNPVDKPSFVLARGEYNGSFIRGDDGDRLLTRYEVTQLRSNRTQPTDDLEPVRQASLDDLDPKLVRAVLAHARDRAPRSFEGIDDVDGLVRLRAVSLLDGVPTPTLAGLLCLGRYPQQFFPQLFVAFVALPGLTMGETAPDGARFLDNQTVDGPIPIAISEVSIALRRNMNRAAIIRGLGREDRYDYPLEVIRELVVNALMHRDYSPESRGSHVQIELYPDRLVVKSPGGLYGGMTVDALGSGSDSTSRNATLAKLLADVPMPEIPAETICENRGSGLLRVMTSLRKAGMSPPEFDVRPGSVRITVPRNALLSPETIAWIGSLELRGLSDEQHLALAMMRNAGRANSGMLQAWGVDAAKAGRALRDLVSRGAAIRRGGKRYATYHLLDLLPAQEAPMQKPLQANRTGREVHLDAVVQAIRAGHVTARGLSEHLGVGYQAMLRRLRILTERGVIEPTRPLHSSRQSYRLVAERSRDDGDERSRLGGDRARGAGRA